MASADNPVGPSPNDLWRASIDASVVMAASLSETGAAHDLFIIGRGGRVFLTAGTHALVETERNLYRKAPHGLSRFWELRKQLTVIDPSPDLVATVVIDIEPKDAAIVAAAVAASAHFLVTYDRRHLLGASDLISQRFHVETVTPGQLLQRLRGASQP